MRGSRRDRTPPPLRLPPQRPPVRMRRLGLRRIAEDVVGEAEKGA